MKQIMEREYGILFIFLKINNDIVYEYTNMWKHKDLNGMTDPKFRIVVSSGEAEKDL